MNPAQPSSQAQTLQQFLELTNRYVTELGNLADDSSSTAQPAALAMIVFAENVAGQAIATVQHWPT